MISDDTKKSPVNALRILHLERLESITNLVRAKLRTEGLKCEFLRVKSCAEFISALESGKFDLILADHSLSQFNESSALAIARKSCPDLPFIFVSGALAEETAGELLRAGATDCVLKSSLHRLAPVILRALREAEARNHHKQVEDKLQAMHDIQLAMSTLDLPDILRIILEKTDIFLSQAAATIVLFDSTTGKIEPIVCRNIDEALWRAESRSDEHPIERMVLQSNRRRIIRNFQESARTLRSQFYMRQGLASYLGLPLTAREQVIGVLSLFTKHEHDFTDKEIDFAEMLAAQAGTAVWIFRLCAANSQLSHERLDSEHQVRKLVTGLINARDDEARRIARVLHDESGQLLASVHISLDETAKQLPASFKLRLNEAKKLLDQVENRLRGLSHELYPTILEDLGLVASVKSLAEQMSKRIGIRITVETQLSSPLSPLLELTIYRLVQEALNNTARHAGASKA